MQPQFVAIMKIKCKRVYEKADKLDGIRILVDRLWPRGMTKEKANVDLWLKELAPSTELRKWFGHKPEKWEEFRIRYLLELKEKEEQIALIKEKLNQSDVTILYGAKDESHNEAIVLMEKIREE